MQSHGHSGTILPVDTDEEKKLFKRLVAAQSGSTNFEQMALDWCDKVDGVKVFPKLPVYLRTYFQKVERIDRIKDAVRSAKKGQEFLSALNQRSGGDITVLHRGRASIITTTGHRSRKRVGGGSWFFFLKLSLVKSRLYSHPPPPPP